MKIKLIIGIVAVVLVIGVVAAVLGIKLAGDDTIEETTEAIAEGPDTSKLGIFHVDNIAYMRGYVENNELVLQESDDATFFAVADIGIAGQSVNMFIQTDAEGNFTRIDGSCSVEFKKKDSERFYEIINNLEYVAAELFALGEVEKHTIYGSDGAMIHSTTEEPLDKVLTENAKYTLSVIDYDNTYWSCRAYIEDDALKIEFFHVYDSSLLEFEAVDMNLAHTPEEEVSVDEEQAQEEELEEVSDASEEVTENTEEITAVEEEDENI